MAQVPTQVPQPGIGGFFSFGQMLLADTCTTAADLVELGTDVLELHSD